MLGRLRKANERFLPGHLAFGPTHVVLGVNNFCNLRCMMCDVGTENEETNFGANLVGAKTRYMPLDLFERIVAEMKAFCPTAHLALAFTEPLAWPLLDDALAHARDNGRHVSVTTNGLLLERHADALANGACRYLSVSLDGPEEVHDRIRRRTGSYARAVAGIAAVAAKKDPPRISVYCAISEFNVGSLRQFLRDMSNLPLERVGLLHNIFVTGPQAEDHNRLYDGDLHATPSNVFLSDPAKIDLETLSAELSEIAAADYPFPVVIQPNLTHQSDLETYYRKPEVFIGRRCIDANRMIMIDSDGEAIPVHGRCFRFPIANIRNRSLAEIWHHPKLSEMRRALHRAGGLLPACSRCCSGFGGAIPRNTAVV